VKQVRLRARRQLDPGVERGPICWPPDAHVVRLPSACSALPPTSARSTRSERSGRSLTRHPADTGCGGPPPPTRHGRPGAYEQRASSLSGGPPPHQLRGVGADDKKRAKWADCSRHPVDTTSGDHPRPPIARLPAVHEDRVSSGPALRGSRHQRGREKHAATPGILLGSERAARPRSAVPGRPAAQVRRIRAGPAPRHLHGTTRSARCGRSHTRRRADTSTGRPARDYPLAEERASCPRAVPAARSRPGVCDDHKKRAKRPGPPASRRHPGRAAR
jgi:hypothetical protein